MKNFEIHDLTTNEVLSENLTFEEVPELFNAYATFYPDHDITVCQRNTKNAYISSKIKNEFKTQWLMLVENHLCNFY